jgi:hypothetical protein
METKRYPFLSGKLNHEMKVRIVNIAGNPLLLSFVITFILFLVLPDVAKYSLELAGKQDAKKAAGYAHYVYYDLNGNGETELIQSCNNTRFDHSIFIRHYNGKNFNQWNFPGKVPEHGRRLYIGDADDNGLSEIYLFSQIEDSIFLHFFEPMNPDGLNGTKIFIDCVKEVRDRVDYFLIPHQLIDLSGNGLKSFVFNLYAAFSLQPRQVYTFTPLTGELTRSPATGFHINTIQLFDLDQDGRSTIFLSTFAPGNISPADSIPYPDSSAWLAVLNHDLQFRFEPVEFPGFNRVVVAYPFQFNGGTAIMAHATSRKVCDSCDLIAIYNKDGTLMKSRILNENWEKDLMPINWNGLTSNTLLFYHMTTGQLYNIDEQLKLHPYKTIPSRLILYPHVDYQLAIEDKNRPDYYFSKTEDGFYLLRSGFKYSIHAHVENFSGIYPVTISLKKGADLKKAQIAVQSDEFLYIFNLKVNVFYSLRWWLLLLVFLVLTGLLYLSRYLYMTQLMRRQEIERQISGLQYQTMVNQLNPHFVFNSINSIIASVITNRREEAYQFGSRYANLIREVLTSSDSITRPLEKEFEFVWNYLELERFRFKNSFIFTIELDDDVNPSCQVPKMIVQIFAENAVKHGLADGSHPGELLIKASRLKEQLLIIIEDNGIGRKEAAGKNTQSTGKGMVIAQQLADLYFKLLGHRISFRIVDGDILSYPYSGTRVEILIETDV